MKSIVTIILAGAVVVVLAIAGFSYLNRPKPAVVPPTSSPTAVTPTATTVKPAPTPPATVIPTPTQTPPSIQQSATTLEQTINNVAATGKSQEATLTITESEANAQAATMLSGATMPPDVPIEIKGVSIDFKAGNIINADIDATLRSVITLSVKIKVQLQVSIQAGKPAAKVTDVSFTGAALVPQSLKDQMTALISQQVDELLVQLTNTQFAGGKVTLEYKAINIQETAITITLLVKPI